MANFQMVNALSMNIKDSRWLQLEVCREYQRNKCSRSDTECKFAHPQPHVEVQNGKVTACFDSIKGRCNREKPPCKYFHPPQHLKEQLLINGRNNLAIKNALMQQITTGGMPMPGAMPVHSPGQMVLAYTAGAEMTSPAQIYGVPPNLAQYYPAAPTPSVGEPGMVMSQLQPKMQRSDRLEVCREFQRGACKRAEQECRYAHPPDQVAVDDGQVTVCMDAVKGRCGREPCRYFHPPSHLQAQLRAPRASPALGEPAYDAQLYFGAFPSVGVAYKRPTGDKAGITCYPTHSAASYQQLMLQQQQQNYLHPTSCEYPVDAERPASGQSAGSGAAAAVTNGGASPPASSSASDGGVGAGAALDSAASAAGSQQMATVSAGLASTLSSGTSLAAGIPVINPALYTGYSLSKAALPAAGAAAAGVRPVWQTAAGLSAVGMAADPQLLLHQQLQQQHQQQQQQRLLQLQQQQRLLQQQYAVGPYAPPGAMYAAPPPAAAYPSQPAAYSATSYLMGAQAAGSPYLAMAGYGQHPMLANAAAAQPGLPPTTAAVAAAAVAAYAQIQNGGEPAYKRMRKM